MRKKKKHLNILSVYRALSTESFRSTQQQFSYQVRIVFLSSDTVFKVLHQSYKHVLSG